MKSIIFSFLASVMVVVFLPLSGATASAEQQSSPHRKLQLARAGLGIKNQYIVVLKPRVADVTIKARTMLRSASTLSTKLGLVYQDAIKGFVVSGLAQGLLFRLLLDDDVDYIAEDSIVTLTADQAKPKSWGLDRIDQTSLPLNQNYHYDYTGAGVEAYVIDTGIRTTHSDFKNSTSAPSRASCGINYISAENCTDLNGHGTHVAGTIGGNLYGVAKGVTLFAVKVLSASGSGSMSTVVAGVNYVTMRKKATPTKAMVANLSLGGSYYKVLNDAVAGAVAAGVVVAVAAGNDNADACKYSPSSAAEALTVGATTSTDARASYSNFGTCVDIFAPGSSIISCGISSDTATATMSGTSMASPHVAGVAALMLQKKKDASPAEVLASMLKIAAVNKVKTVGTNSTNRLLQVPVMDLVPSSAPSRAPSRRPSQRPSRHPSEMPSRKPSAHPTALHTSFLSVSPSRSPHMKPSSTPTRSPAPTPAPSSTPTRVSLCSKAVFSCGRGASWLHSTHAGQCRMACVANREIDLYFSRGYKCGRCHH